MSRGRRTEALILGVALAARLSVVGWAWERVLPTADGRFYHVVASRIAEGLGYTWLWPDGAVTYAAHYPVGYPALLGGLYWVFGSNVGVAMVFNAVLGAGGVWAATVLSRRWLEAVPSPHALPASAAVGLFLALHPTLIAYTPALMTELVVGSLLVLAALVGTWLHRALRRRSEVNAGGLVNPESARASQDSRVGVGNAMRAGLALLALLGLLAAATYVRPQSVLLVPVIGGAIGFVGASRIQRWWAALASSLLVSACVLVLCMPWTLRNCDRMDRCLFMSANGGWNLLIGTFEEGQGAWVALDGDRVPEECREVFDEAAKDACFGAAAKRRIASEPMAWLRQIPAKWRATFDYTASATAHLREAGALSESRRLGLQVAEHVGQRIFNAFALLGAWVLARRRNASTAWAWAFLGFGLLSFAGLGSAWGWICVVVLLVRQAPWLESVALSLAAWSILATLGVHAVFFGAGRYSMPLLFTVAPLAALGVDALWKSCRRTFDRVSAAG